MPVREFIARVGLNVRLALLVVGITFGGILVSFFLQVTFEQQQIFDSAKASALNTSLTTKAGIEDAMLQNRPEAVERTFATIVSVGVVTRVRILDIEGRVWRSSDSGEVGQVLSPSGTECQVCHAQRKPIPDRMAVEVARSGQDTIVGFTLIENQPQCHTCHDAQKAILGHVMTESPPAEYANLLRAGFWKIALTVLTTFVLLVGLLIPTLRRLVLRPLRELGQAAQEMGTGNLDYRLRTHRSDELGDLARAFDDMRTRLAATSAQMGQRNQELGLLNELALAASQMQNAQQIMDLALDTVVGKMNMQAGQIHLVDERTNTLQPVATRGLSDSIWQRTLERAGQVENKYTELVFRNAETIYVPDMRADSHFAGIYDDDRSRSYLCIPLRTRGVMMGTLSLNSQPGLVISAAQVPVFAAIGYEIGIALDNALLLAKTRQGEQAARALYELGQGISGSLDLDHVLNSVAAGTRRGLGADVGIAGLLVAERQEISLAAASGALTESWRGAMLSLEQGTAGSVLRANQLLVVAERNADHVIPALDAWLDQEKIGALIVAPLWSKASLIGMIVVGFRQLHWFSQGDLDFLTRLTHQAAIAVENAQLHRQVRNMAVLEERDRLAREMHDNIAQNLAYIHFKLAVAQDLLSTGRDREAQESLRELEKAAMEAHTDVREQIFGLRATALLRLGFVAALQDYAKEYQARYGVNTRVRWEENVALELAPDVAIHLLRIVQEALTNCRKHAHANQVVVTIRRADDLSVAIEDDGRGFDPDKSPSNPPHYGLQIMRERAESVGGRLTVDSQPGGGTRIAIYIPWNRKDDTDYGPTPTPTGG